MSTTTNNTANIETSLENDSVQLSSKYVDLAGQLNNIVSGGDALYAKFFNPFPTQVNFPQKIALLTGGAQLANVVSLPYDPTQVIFYDFSNAKPYTNNKKGHKGQIFAVDSNGVAWSGTDSTAEYNTAMNAYQVALAQSHNDIMNILQLEAGVTTDTATINQYGNMIPSVQQTKSHENAAYVGAIVLGILLLIFIFRA